MHETALKPQLGPPAGADGVFQKTPELSWSDPIEFCNLPQICAFWGEKSSRTAETPRISLHISSFLWERNPTGVSNSGLEQQGLLALPCISQQPEIHRNFSRSCRGYSWHYLHAWELPSQPWQLGSARMDTELMQFPSKFTHF